METRDPNEPGFTHTGLVIGLIPVHLEYDKDNIPGIVASYYWCEPLLDIVGWVLDLFHAPFPILFIREK